MRKLLKPLIGLLPKKLVWYVSSQTIEYRFHKNNEWRKSDEFMRQTAKLFEHWQYTPQNFANELIVDLGAGSKLRSKFFESAKIVAIEPLADRFLDSIEWSDLKDAYRVFSAPAEALPDELIGQVSFVMCINVLDHVFDYEQVLENVYKMLTSGGQFLLSVDLHDNPSLTHPSNFNKNTLKSSIQRIGFKQLREYNTLPEAMSNYGEGEAWTVVLER